MNLLVCLFSCRAVAAGAPVGVGEGVGDDETNLLGKVKVNLRDAVRGFR